MKIKLGILIVALLLILSACGSEDKAKTAPPETQPTIKEEGAKEDGTNVEESKKNDTEAEKPIETSEEKKTLSEDESLALEYVNIFVNGTNIENKKQFVKNKVHPDVQQIFKLGESSISPENKRFMNPEVIESIPFSSQGKKGHYVLIHSKDESGKIKEIIILTADGKVAFGYSNSPKEDENKAFEKVRSDFKTPQLK